MVVVTQCPGDMACTPLDPIEKFAFIPVHSAISCGSWSHGGSGHGQIERHLSSSVLARQPEVYSCDHTSTAMLLWSVVWLMILTELSLCSRNGAKYLSHHLT